MCCYECWQHSTEDVKAHVPDRAAAPSLHSPFETAPASLVWPSGQGWQLLLLSLAGPPLPYVPGLQRRQVPLPAAPKPIVHAAARAAPETRTS